MTGRWGSPNDRVLGGGLGAGFLVLVAVSTLVPGAERVLNTGAFALLAVAVLALVVGAVAFLVAYFAGERAIAWECVRPLEGLETGKSYVSAIADTAPASGDRR
ncbi:MAG: hypothetical protein ACT4O0_01505 [Pseudonocardia sp.]